MKLDEQIKNFELLKEEVAAVFIKSHPSANLDISKWKGLEIIDFQEDMMINVKSRVSEKWFYTYFKSPIRKLPRIDMLHALAKYAGENNWHQFVDKHQQKKHLSNNTKSNIRKKPILYLAFLPVLIVLFIFVLSFWKTYYYFEYCFYDAELNSPIESATIEIFNLKDYRQTPIYKKLDQQGCFSYRSTSNTLNFVIKSPYYKTDTIIRTITDYHHKEKVQLTKDYYTLMLHYYSNSKVDDWRNRRAQLNKLFDNSAEIYQLFNPPNKGVEIYSKQDFIDKMTFPFSTIRNIEILNAEYREDKIIRLTFRIQPDEK